MSCTQSSQPILSVCGVSKTYGEGAAATRALDRASVDIFPGEVVLLMGPSGSGKTTLISIMGCILRASSGSVKIAGREVAHLSERELPEVRLGNIGFIFQGFNLFPTLTAGENVELALDLKNVRGPQAQQQAAALLEQVGLAEKYNSFPADLSGGQKQRVAIARAIINEPKIVLADEPTGNLDTKNSDIVLAMLRDLNKEFQQTIVMITHNPEAALYASRVVHMRDGVIVDGVPKDAH